MTGLILRWFGVAIALLALIDPAVVSTRQRPAPVRLMVVESAGVATGLERAEAVKRRLVENLRGRIDVSDRQRAAAIVLIGDRPPATLPWEELPISTVALHAASSPNVRIIRVDEPPAAPLRQAAVVEAEFEATGMSGKTSPILLEDRGIVAARAEHRWTKDRERFRARLRYAPASAGIHRVTVSAAPLPEETTTADNMADAAVLVDERPLRILAYEPRPSWNATFVRRALEADGRFSVAALVRSSRGVTVRSGGAPMALTAASLEGFDVVIVGAPEELRSSEVDVLSTFSARRAGGVLFLPDRLPAGPYAGVLPAEGFAEMLVENPVELAALNSSDIRASELLVAQGVSPAASTLAAVDRSGQPAPVSLTWTHGTGRMILWGALDAWRFRSERDSAFTRFWQGTVADLAMGAPEPVSVEISPRIAAVDEQVLVRATLRSTEFTAGGERIVMPAVAAALLKDGGVRQPIRLWPTAELGIFEGYTVASQAGSYEIEATAGRHAGRASVIVESSPRRAGADDTGALKLIAESTGGVAVQADDMAPLESHLRKLAGQSERVMVRPMRSPWWLAPFALCLCAEWALRRRRGQR